MYPLQPASLFQNYNKMKSSVKFAMQNHILERHKYKSLNDRRKYMTTHGEKKIKSVFDDFLQEDDITKYIMETIQNPTYVVQKEWRFKEDLSIEFAYLVTKR